MSSAQIARAESLLDLGRAGDAVSLLKRLLTENPHDEQALGLLAQSHLELGQHSDALAAADRLLSECAESDWGLRLRAISLDGLGRHRDAIVAAERARRLAPLAYETHLTFAQVVVEEPGREREALAAAIRAVELAPEEADTHAALGAVAQRVPLNKLARAAYRTALRIDPEHATAMNNLTVMRPGLRIGRDARRFATVLFNEPGSEGARANVEGLVARMLERLYACSILGAALGLVSMKLGDPGDPTDARDRLLAAAVGIGLAGVVVGYPMSLWRASPPGVRRYGRDRLLRSKRLIVTGLVAMTAFVGAEVVCFVPPAGTWAPQIIIVLGLRMIFALARRAWQRANEPSYFSRSY